MKRWGYPDSRDEYAWKIVHDARFAFDMLGAIVVLRRKNRWFHLYATEAIPTKTP